jgi:hypothetical protein
MNEKKQAGIRSRIEQSKVIIKKIWFNFLKFNVALCSI